METMALAKQTLTLIFISALFFSTFCVDAHSAPSPASDPGPVQPETETVEIGLNPSELSLPDVMGTTPEVMVGEQADVANVVAKHMQAVKQKIGEFSATLKKRMDNPETSPAIKECLVECDEVFGAAVDDVKNMLESLDSQNLVKANFDVSAVSTNVDTCNDCFNEMVGEDPEVKKLDDWVQRITGEALKALQTVTS